jgi:regulator of sigma E protease
MLFLNLYRILALTIVLGIIVLVHELGHFIAARLMGVRVETFSFGFGKRLFGKKIGDTDVRVSLVPLGGYVKMAGEEDYDSENPKPDEFLSKNRGQKIFILFMGPFMNFLLAFFILTIINITGVEVETYKLEDPVIGYIQKDAPAEKAGLKKGDLIISVAGKQIPDWRELELTIGSNPNEELEVVYERNGKRETTKMKVGVIAEDNPSPGGVFWNYKTQVASLDPEKPAFKSGLKEGDIILSVNQKLISVFEIRDIISKNLGNELNFQVQRGDEIRDLKVTPREFKGEVLIGIGMNFYAPTIKTKYGLLKASLRSIKELGRLTSLTFHAFRKLFTGKISPKNISGPIDIAKVSQRAMESGLSNLFLLIAFLSLHIGIINLFPIPALDGGHLMIYSIEAVIRRDFGPKLKTLLMNTGFFLLIALMVFVILNDISKNLPNGWNSLLPF